MSWMAWLGRPLLTCESRPVTYEAERVGVASLPARFKIDEYGVSLSPLKEEEASPVILRSLPPRHEGAGSGIRTS